MNSKFFSKQKLLKFVFGTIRAKWVIYPARSWQRIYALDKCLSLLGDKFPDAAITSCTRNFWVKYRLAKPCGPKRTEIGNPP